jgi:hypothetical protein
MKDEKTWKLGEPGAEETILKNARALRELIGLTTKVCGNPFCQYPLDNDKETAAGLICVMHVSDPTYGELCATCRDLRTSISMMNVGLKNPHFFRAASDLDKAARDEEIKKHKRLRDRMGLDDKKDGDHGIT